MEEIKSVDVMQGDTPAHSGKTGSTEKLVTPNKQSVEEVEATTEDEWEDIIGSGDLKKKVLTPGESNSRPSKGDTVEVEVTMRRDGGVAVQDTHRLTFTLGDCEVIPGLELVVPLMDRREEALVHIAPRFAYGDKGETSLEVPPESTIECTVKLVGFTPEQSPLELSVATRRDVGERKRARGNWWYARGDHSEAVQCYKAAVDFLDDTETGEATGEVRELIEQRLKALNNMAAAQLELTLYTAALSSLRQVLDCQPRNVKALYRRARALRGQNKMADALGSLQTALEVEPNNRAVQVLLKDIAQQVKNDSQSEKKLYRRMLGLKKGENAPADPRQPMNVAPWKTFCVSFLSLSVLGVAYSFRDNLYALVQ